MDYSDNDMVLVTWDVRCPDCNDSGETFCPYCKGDPGWSDMGCITCYEQLYIRCQRCNGTKYLPESLRYPALHIAYPVMYWKSSGNAEPSDSVQKRRWNEKVLLPDAKIYITEPKTEIYLPRQDGSISSAWGFAPLAFIAIMVFGKTTFLESIAIIFVLTALIVMFEREHRKDKERKAKEAAEAAEAERKKHPVVVLNVVSHNDLRVSIASEDAAFLERVKNAIISGKNYHINIEKRLIEPQESPHFGNGDLKAFCRSLGYPVD